MMQKKKMQKKMEDDKSREGDTSMDNVAMLEGECKVCTSMTPSDSGALAAGYLLEDGKDLTFQSYGKMMMTKTMAARMDYWGGRWRSIEAHHKEDTGEATERVERKWSNDAEEEDAEEDGR
jgi:hypothetical protein